MVCGCRCATPSEGVARVRRDRRDRTIIEPVRRAIAPGSAACYSIREVDGLGENRGHE